MKYIRKNLNKFEEIFLFPLGDLHGGAATADYDEFKKYLDLAGRLDNAFIILMGDLVEMAGRNSPGNSVWEQTIAPEGQFEWMMDTFEPYKDKIIATVNGNHENRIKMATGIDTMKIFARSLGIPYVPRSAITRINLLNNAFSVFFTHGNGSGKTPTLKLRRLRDIVTFVHNCDIYLMGHHHCSLGETMLLKEPDVRMKKVVTREILLQMTGAFLRFDDSYAEEANMQPTSIDAPIICLNSKGFKRLYLDDFGL